jgi:DNA adenine methylase
MPPKKYNTKKYQDVSDDFSDDNTDDIKCTKRLIKVNNKSVTINKDDDNFSDDNADDVKYSKRLIKITELTQAKIVKKPKKSVKKFLEKEDKPQDKPQENQQEDVKPIKKPKTVKKKTEDNVEKHLGPIIKWSGGKSDEIKMFFKHFPEKYDTYLEPFIGGGSVYFYLNPQKAVITDVHTELIDLYNSIKDGHLDDIYNFMEENKNDETTYYNIRNNMVINNALDNAKRFYYQRKTCFRGMLRYNRDGKFNIPFGKYKTINYSDLKNNKYEDLLKRTEIIKASYEYVFENYNNENNFMFLDPPYDSEFTDYGYCKFGKEEQKKLAKMFKETKIKCLMIIGKTDFIEELYKEYIVEEYQKNYRFKIYAGRIGDEINVKHLVIKNYK